MAAGDRILEITFVSVPSVGATISVNVKVLGGGINLRGESFQPARLFNGQAAISSDLNVLAANYATAFNLDYCAAGNLQVTSSGPVVVITIPSGSTFDYFDDCVISGAFATFDFSVAVANNVIHRIWFSPIHSTPSPFVYTNYLITQNNLQIVTQSGQNIITNG